jgi:aspartate 1-decarboxylase
LGALDQEVAFELSHGAQHLHRHLAGRTGQVRRAQLGDLVIVAAFAMVDEAERKAAWKPDLVFVDENNRIKGSRDHVPVQQWT